MVKGWFVNLFFYSKVLTQNLKLSFKEGGGRKKTKLNIFVEAIVTIDTGKLTIFYTYPNLQKTYTHNSKM
jgi:hypothetical protein